MTKRSSLLARVARRRARGATRNRHPLVWFCVLLGLSALLLTLGLETISWNWSTPFVIGVCLGMSFLQLERAGFMQLLEEARDHNDGGGGTARSRSGDRAHLST